MTRVVCHQLAPALGDPGANRKMALRAITAAVADGADVIVLPELTNSGYMFDSAEEAAALAIPATDPLLGEWGRCGEGAVVIAGFCERGEDGNVYNSAAVTDATGVIGVYRKVHLWDREKLWFTPGPAAPVVHDTPAGRIGVLVCYDIEFPEMPRTLALAGAELIAVPTNWPLVQRPDGERPPEVTVAMAAARVNRVAVACCDRTGVERGQAWNAGTSIIDEQGWVRAAQGGVGPAAAELDLSRSHDKRFTELADALADRRPELYGALTLPASQPAAR
ncbi:MAG: nitrilase-related carbon-nitrogen hydrolase [Solirubrobacteraceae bacterium]